MQGRRLDASACPQCHGYRWDVLERKRYGMTATVTKITCVNGNAVIPVGTHDGNWGGYTATCVVDGFKYELTTDVGIRTPAAPAKVTVSRVGCATVRVATPDEIAEAGKAEDDVVDQFVTNLFHPTEDIRFILGRPHFALGLIAELMRQGGGHDIPRKFEDEQCHVILFMLQHYKDDPQHWRTNFDSELASYQRKALEKANTES